MPIKPEKQNPFWPAVPQGRRGPRRWVVIVMVIGLALVALRFVARIVLG